MITVKTNCRKCGNPIEKNFATAGEAHAFSQAQPILCEACQEPPKKPKTRAKDDSATS